MIVVANFKGADGSKGYRSGKPYELIFQVSHPGCTIIDRNRKDESGGSGGSLVKYSSMRKFLDNWDVMK